MSEISEHLDSLHDCYDDKASAAETAEIDPSTSISLPVITEYPTNAPTASPTKPLPTNYPTNSPLPCTDMPTLVPTVVPTYSTSSPTASSPTVRPTSNQTSSSSVNDTNAEDESLPITANVITVNDTKSTIKTSYDVGSATDLTELYTLVNNIKSNQTLQEKVLRSLYGLTVADREIIKRMLFSMQHNFTTILEKIVANISKTERHTLGKAESVELTLFKKLRDNLKSHLDQQGNRLNQSIQSIRTELGIRGESSLEAAKKLATATSHAKSTHNLLDSLLVRAGKYASGIQEILNTTELTLSKSKQRVVDELTEYRDSLKDQLNGHINKILADGQAAIADALRKEQEWIQNERGRAEERNQEYRNMVIVMKKLSDKAAEREEKNKKLVALTEERYNFIVNKANNLAKAQKKALRLLEFNRSQHEQAWWKQQENLQQKHVAVLKQIEEAEAYRAKKHAELESKLEHALEDTRNQYHQQIEIEKKKARLREKEAIKEREKCFQKSLEKSLVAISTKNAELEQMHQKLLLEEKAKMVEQRKKVCLFFLNITLLILSNTSLNVNGNYKPQCRKQL